MRKYLLLLLMLSIPVFGFAQSTKTRRPNKVVNSNRTKTASISGIVTFRVNSVFGNRADIGGMVYLIPYSNNSEKLQSDVDVFTEKAKWFHYFQEKEARFADMGGDREAVKRAFGNDYVDPRQFLDLGLSLYKRINEAKDNSIAEALIDANGMYKLDNFKQGVYYVMIISANKKYPDAFAFKEGLVHLQKVDLTQKTQIVSSYNFDFEEEE